MKKISILVSAGLFLFLVGCEKDFLDKDKKGKCGFGEHEKFEGKDHKDKDDKDKFEKIIYEPIQYSDDCNCIVAGKIKYIEYGETTALVDYGDGTCDDQAVKISCYDGDCDHPKAEKYTFTIDCKDKDGTDIDAILKED